MIDPVIFSIQLTDTFALTFRWYGLILMLGVVVGALVADRQIVKRGGKSDWIWDPIIIVVPAAVIGARVWFVLNSILGGGTYFTDNPGKIWRIDEGGLHIFGALLFGGLAAYLYTRTKKVDFLLILDSIAPALLIAQAVARPANYINQELYGQPTGLPWGISILPENRMFPYNDLQEFPESTRFHPTFAYEMIWNFLAAGLILWLTKRYGNKLKPGAAFALWLVLAGVGRAIIEFWRPDQPVIPGTLLSYSRLVSILMAIGGTFWLLVRYEIIRIPRLSPGPAAYRMPTSRAALRKSKK